MTGTSDFERLARSLRATYKLKSTLGSGGVAHVYAADDLKTGRRVAIKALREEQTTPMSVRRFLAEINIAARLEHPNIIPFYDSGTADGLPYYVMPFVEGQSLRARLERVGRLSIDEALDICDQIAAALDYAHRRRVVHRDIKPENILLHSGRALVFDFGIAQPFNVMERQRPMMPPTVLGTPAYMSPEQARGDGPVDGRSDVYSLACMAYEMMCGFPPFTGSSPSILLRRQMSAVPLSLRYRLPSIPHGVSAAVSRALAKSPADRFATPGAFAVAMRDAVSVGETTNRRVATANNFSSPVLGSLRDRFFVLCKTVH